ncbi:hypothetical protein CcI6DRAFT_02865 [Frankia sp. CcI6]|nr:hypothetical protein CcI6DRAFT_02865 [Frankia sp. CcI6]OAA29077.1 hypothetical protein AAY23_101710 [Frankia casuarinae]
MTAAEWIRQQLSRAPALTAEKWAAIVAIIRHAKGRRNG